MLKQYYITYMIEENKRLQKLPYNKKKHSLYGYEYTILGSDLQQRYEFSEMELYRFLNKKD